jgi:hypothetical protein
MFQKSRRATDPFRIPLATTGHVWQPSRDNRPALPGSWMSAANTMSNLSPISNYPYGYCGVKGSTSEGTMERRSNSRTDSCMILPGQYCKFPGLLSRSLSRVNRIENAAETRPSISNAYQPSQLGGGKFVRV